MRLLLALIISVTLVIVDSRPKSWREGPIVDPGVFVITQIKECRNRMGYCILGMSCNVDTDFVPDDLGGHCNQLSEAFNPKANFVCCKQNPDLFTDDKSDELEAVILEHNINHPTAAESTAEAVGQEDNETDKVEEVVPEENVDDKEGMTSTDMIDELYTKPTPTVEDVTKVVTKIVTNIVNTTEATHQEDVTNKIDFSTLSYTTSSPTTTLTSEPIKKESESSFVFPSIGSSVLDSLPPVLEAGPWIEKPPVPSWDDLESDNIEEETDIKEDTEGSEQGEEEILAAGGWSDVFEWSDDNDEPREVYEIELEQTIAGAGAGTSVSGAVLRPGLVIDDPELIQSIVSTNEETREYDELEPAYRSEENDFVDGMDLYLEEVVDPPLSVVQSFSGSVEEVPILEYSEFYPAVVTYDDAQDIVYSEYSNLVEPESELSQPSSSEPEIHCDLSILLSGISCTFNILDDKGEGQPPLLASSDLDKEQPLILTPPEPEEAIVEIPPPQLPWSTVQESLTVNEVLNDSLKLKTDERIAENTLVQKLNVIDNKVDFNAINGELESSVEETLVALNTSLQDEDKDINPSKKKSKTDSKKNPNSNKTEPDKEVRHVVQHLEDLEKDTELLQIIIDQLQLLDNNGNTNISINGQNIGSSSELLESTSMGSPDKLKSTTEASVSSVKDSENILPASALDKPREKVCGVKGGQYVQNAYGKSASKYILPLLIDSWVFGKDSRQKARFDDVKGRISGGRVTSTVLYCWVAAIVTRDKGEFVCTGTLVAEDLVITSGSCINHIFKRGLDEFKVVLGDSNLRLDLAHGVQEHTIAKAAVHEDYDLGDSVHHHDIGFVLLRTPARLEDSVCLLCLPRPDVDIDQDTCTVTGWGKPALTTPLPRAAAYWEDTETDGILREAELQIVDTERCADSLDMNAEDMKDFVCGDTRGEEREQAACFQGLDGGSPLACEAEGRHYLGGIVIFSTVCGGQAPSVFLKVSNYVGWILENYAAIRYN